MLSKNLPISPSFQFKLGSGLDKDIQIGSFNPHFSFQVDQKDEVLMYTNYVTINL